MTKLNDELEYELGLLANQRMEENDHLQYMEAKDLVTEEFVNWLMSEFKFRRRD